MSKFGSVPPGSTEWTLQRHPEQRIQISRAKMEMLQAENALLHDVLAAARDLLWPRMPGPQNTVWPLRTAIERFDGWLDNPGLRDEIVQKLLNIVDDLEDGRSAS